ncbi:MAG: hypothetical protein QGI52_05845 [Alphaproteobacteria bacterium]|nr:hypothetical protein [Alphaproteobacteria bacterium]
MTLAGTGFGTDSARGVDSARGAPGNEIKQAAKSAAADMMAHRCDGSRGIS